MKRHGRSGSNAWWIASAAALVGLVGVQLADTPVPFMGSAEALPLSVRSTHDDRLQIDHEEAWGQKPDVQLIAAITHRSLFEKTRNLELAQAAQTTSNPTAAERKQPPSIELVGTLLSRRSEVALVNEGRQGTRHLRVGDTVDNWKIVRIQRDNLTLMLNDALAPFQLR